MKAFESEVQAVRSRLPKPKGAFGRRHVSRGLTGFYDKARAYRRPMEEFLGYTLVDKLREMGRDDEASRLEAELDVQHNYQRKAGER